jgi:putative ABC transport system permease protein
MLINYLKSALRNLFKDRISLIVNVLGLSISFAGFLLIFQYVLFQRSFDRFHEKAGRIYRVAHETYQGGKLELKNAVTYPAVGPALQAAYPQIETAVRVRRIPIVVEYGRTKFMENELFAADSSFFNVFSFPLTSGAPASVLSGVNAVALSESMAKKYFGNDTPVGKQIVLRKGNTSLNVMVKGVFADVPDNSHLDIDFLVSYPTSRSLGVEPETSWEQLSCYTYLLLKPGTNPERLERNFVDVVAKYKGKVLADIKAEEILKLQAVSDIHLHSDLNNEAKINSNANLLNYLFMLGLFILIIAWINYINLSTARAVRRSMEIGVRKAIGATRGQLFAQHVFESALINLVAISTALLVAYVVQTQVNGALRESLPLAAWGTLGFWATVLGLWLLSTSSAGIYPALVLSRIEPVVALKGKSKFSVGGLNLRKALVVFQFSVSVMMLVGVIAVYSQITYMNNKDLGIKMDQTLVIKAPAYIPDDPLYKKNIEVFRNELARRPGVKNFSATGAVPGSETYSVGGMIRRVEAAPDQVKTYSLVWVDYDFVPAFGLNVLAGRNFSKEYGTDQQGVLVNETAAQQLGYKNPQDAVGGRISAYGEYQIIGVINDYHQEYLKKKFVPLIFYLNNSSNNYYSVKLGGGNITATVQEVQKVYENLFPGNPFDFFFLDEFFEKQYQSDRQFSYIFGFFTVLAIVIACTGLFGLSSFMVAQRTQEISIRKILGASSTNIAQLVSKDYLLLILVSSALAWPIAYYGVSGWLDNYAFRIKIGWLLFALPTLIVLLIVLLTISYQIIKTALANPIKYLRYE